MFKIITGENLSIDDIHNHQRGGGSVLRSAHVGNFNSPTLFLAQEGFPIILHEHLRGDAKIYRPAYVKTGQIELPIADQITLPLTHLTVREDSVDRIESITGKRYQRPARMHYESLRRLFPDNIQLSSELFFAQNPFFQKALDTLSKQFPHLFANFVSKEGKTYNLAENQSSDQQIYVAEDGEERRISRAQISEQTYSYLQQTIAAITENGSNPEGIVMKSNLYVLLSSLCEIYKGRNGVERYRPDRVEVVHFSGAEMYNYLVKNPKQATHNTQELNDLYEVLKREFPKILPGALDFKLVPSGMTERIITDDGRISERYNELFVENQKLKEYFSDRKKMRVSCSDRIRQQVLSMEDHAIKNRILKLHFRINDLPGQIKKGISDAKAMLDDFQIKKDKILGILVSAEIAIIDIYSESGEINRDIKSTRNKISEIAREVKKVKTTIVSQYDMLENNTRLYYPDYARELSQKQLQNMWAVSMRESSRELRQEFSPQKYNGLIHDFKMNSK